jgi:hypothetical protein
MDEHFGVDAGDEPMPPREQRFPRNERDVAAARAVAPGPAEE